MAYFDAASAEPLHPAARETFGAALEQGWADPARLHAEGRRARMLLDHARESVAAVLGAFPDEVSFTASGTQAVHLAVRGTALALSSRDPRTGDFVAGAVEHSCVLQCAAAEALTRGGSLRTAPVDRYGRVDLHAFEALIGSRPALAALQTANHEVGTVQPLGAAAAATAELGVPLLVDAAQSVGRLPVTPGWSLLTASAHKWGGPPGVGVLAVRRSHRWRSPWPDDEREGGRVPGAPNVPAVLAAAAALEAVTATAAADNARLCALVERIRAEVACIPDVQVFGDPHDRLPHLVTFSCLYLDGEAVLGELSRAGHSVGSGSACTASTLRPSHVLEAMGVLSHGNVRISLPRRTTDADVDALLRDLPSVVSRLRKLAGVADL